MSNFIGVKRGIYVLVMGIFEFCHVPSLIGVVKKQFTYKKYYNYPLVWAMTFYVGIFPSSIWFLGSLREIEIHMEVI